MAKTRQQKEEIVKLIADKLGKSRSIVFADFQGLTMKQLSDIRAKLVELQAQFSITKNTLLELALKENKLPIPENLKTGTTATLFAYDEEIAPIKVLVQALKEAQVGKVKAGFWGAELLEAASITKLALLPGKLELQAQVVGTLNAPLFGLVNVLQGNIKNLVYALNQIRVKKGGE